MLFLFYFFLYIYIYFFSTASLLYFIISFSLQPQHVDAHTYWYNTKKKVIYIQKKKINKRPQGHIYMLHATTDRRLQFLNSFKKIYKIKFRKKKSTSLPCTIRSTTLRNYFPKYFK